jgi:hypothetical protein
MPGTGERRNSVINAGTDFGGGTFFTLEFISILRG